MDFTDEGTHIGWNEEYLDLIGLSDLSSSNYVKIGQKVVAPGKLVGSLSNDTSQEQCCHEDKILEGTIIL